RYTTVQPSLTKTSIYGRSEFSSTQYGDPSYEAGAAIGGPLVQDTLGARFAVSYRYDGGWIDRIDPVTLQTVQKNANYTETLLLRLAGLWAPTDKWPITPGIYEQNQQKNDIANYWPLYSDPRDGRQRPAEHHSGDSPAVGRSECQAAMDHGGVLRREPSELSGADSRPDAAGDHHGLDAGFLHRRCVRCRLRPGFSDRRIFPQDRRQGRAVRAVRRVELRAHRPAQGHAGGALLAHQVLV